MNPHSGHGFHHRHHHVHSHFFFGYSAFPFYNYYYYRPYYYPYSYSYYPYPYSYYPYPYGASYYYDYPSYAASTYGNAEMSNAYYKMGAQWAQDLRNSIVTWDKFVEMIRTVVLQASEADRAAFRQGFTAAYGANADAAFEKAWNEAQPGVVIPSEPPATSSYSAPTAKLPPSVTVTENQ